MTLEEEINNSKQFEYIEHLKGLNQLAEVIYNAAVKKGWHSDTISEDAFVESMCNNLHDEVSELHEAWRNNELREPCDKADKMVAAGLAPLNALEEELADIVIRVLDDAIKLRVNIGRAIAIKMKFNESRPHRHGGKRS